MRGVVIFVNAYKCILGNEKTVFYVPLSARNSNICDVCGAECGCVEDTTKKWFPMVGYRINTSMTGFNDIYYVFE